MNRCKSSFLLSPPLLTSLTGNTIDITDVSRHFSLPSYLPSHIVRSCYLFPFLFLFLFYVHNSPLINHFQLKLSICVFPMLLFYTIVFETTFKCLKIPTVSVKDRHCATSSILNFAVVAKFVNLNKKYF